MQSDRSNNYILFALYYDVNNILTTPFKNRTEPCIFNGITKVHDKLRNQGLTPKLNITENELLEDLKIYFEESNVQFQLMTPHMHQINAIGQVVRKFNNRFIHTLCNVESLSPFYLWDRLFPKATMKINILQ